MRDTEGPELDEVTLITTGSVAEVVLDRPELLNPISARPGGTRDQIVWCLEQAETDPQVGAVLLRGAGRSFSSGGDLTGNAMRETPYEHAQFVEAAERFYDRVRALSLPLVAAVHGYCLGAAIGLVSCCDIVIASQNARFGIPESRLGLVGGVPLMSMVGRQWAKFLLLTGELIDAQQAQQIGLVLTVEADDALVERARDLCSRLARLPREAVALNKRALDTFADASGEASGRRAAAAADSLTLSHSPHAKAPDGRSFAEIRVSEGLDGIKAARSAQYDTPWLAKTGH